MAVPAEDELTVQLAYACQLLRITPGAVKEHMIGLFSRAGTAEDVRLDQVRKRHLDVRLSAP